MPVNKNRNHTFISLVPIIFSVITKLSAERQGFEPWEQLPVHRISSAARSTTPASFLKKLCKDTISILFFTIKTMKN